MHPPPPPSPPLSELPRLTSSLQKTGGALGSGYGIASGELRLVEEEGYEQARRVRNVAAHLRRRCFVHKPLSIVVANSGVPEEVRGGEERRERPLNLWRQTQKHAGCTFMFSV